MELSVFDLHCDTADAIYDGNASLLSNSFHISLERMSAFNTYTQVMAVYIPHKLSDEEGYEYWKRVMNYLNTEIRANTGIVESVRNGSELLSCTKRGRIAAIYAIEDSRIIGKNLDRLQEFYDSGVRFMTLTWSGSTIIGGSHNTSDGITEYGRAAVQKMHEIGIVPDISHASEALAEDVCAISAERSKPLVATHSNSYSVWGHTRNLRDRHFNVIKELGGLVGISFCPAHLTDGKHTRVALSDVIPHVEYYLSLGGENTIALGGDFDGTDLPADLDTCSDLYKLANELLKLNYPQSLVDKIFYLNARNFAINNLR